MGVTDSFLPYMEEHVGLWPLYCFTLLALLLSACFTLYFLIAPQKTSCPMAMEPLPPEYVGPITPEKLRQYDGSDATKPLLMAIRGRVYDVSGSRDFYGAGGPYAIFAGKDAGRALAKTSFDEKDLTDNLHDLSAEELEALREWEYKFQNMYTKVGYVIKSKGPTEEQEQSNIREETRNVQKHQFESASNLSEEDEPYIQIDQNSVLS
ncbi:hypothetical protein O6H91_02G105200 [Diphasiastrum complanatum]|uniref:Uncharacterized protein n=1 Tax=Diphasiastrum complanatum TaxID=34168 RepID=A0ACC2EJC3_DIPCM|nr:hypothetical protein O6H91_Y145700 [Diphasiastrum complanatum]KAJ7566483.1 hypothetical protein O6H91_02G105200 [Diphasiastrum complanatum]